MLQHPGIFAMGLVMRLMFSNALQLALWVPRWVPPTCRESRRRLGHMNPLKALRASAQSPCIFSHVFHCYPLHCTEPDTESKWQSSDL
jgi:hypothetical protein